MPPTRAEVAAKHQKARQLARQGWTDTAIAAELHMDRADVRRVRAEADIAPVRSKPQHTTLEGKWRAQTRRVAGGHLEWTGSVVGAARTPVVRVAGKMTTARLVAYRMQHGADPVGQAKPGCGHPGCVAPAHQVDTATLQPVHVARPVYATPEKKFDALTAPEDGHVVWTGPVNGGGLPILALGGAHHLPSHIAFRRRYGREPVGPVRPSCGMAHCLQGDHLDDTLLRNANQEALAALLGISKRAAARWNPAA